MKLRPLLATLAVLAPFAAHAQTGDADAGERSFGKCKSCHQVGETAKNAIGPLLNGLFGHATGAVPGYAYTQANKEAGFTWTPATFADYIRDPKAKIPGTKMQFAGIKNDKEITDLIAYLQQYDAAGKKTGS